MDSAFKAHFEILLKFPPDTLGELKISYSKGGEKISLTKLYSKVKLTIFSEKLFINYNLFIVNNGIFM